MGVSKIFVTYSVFLTRKTPTYSVFLILKMTTYSVFRQFIHESECRRRGAKFLGEGCGMLKIFVSLWADYSPD